MVAEGRLRGLELPLALACFEQASRSGWAAGDAAALAVYWSKRGDP